ncbi:hypothetical protein PM082_013994 [Marasmius tenuissimus]|nr:hypothetical protein PM082_013994 [Marasmius tenuissimus]
MDASVYTEKYQTYALAMSALSICSIWSSRISISLSIVRILPPGRLKKVAVGLAIGCSVLGVAILAYVLVVFKNIMSHHWVWYPMASRWLLVVPQITTDILSSLAIVVLPRYALWNSSSLPTAERRLILVLSASSLLALILSCTMTAFSFNGHPKGIWYSFTLETAMSVMMCNFLVVITALFRLLFRRKRNETAHTFGDSEEGRYYNSGERTIGLGAATQTRTQPFTFTTISTQLSHPQSIEMGGDSGKYAFRWQ